MKSISLGRVDSSEHKWMWHFTKHGIYSVRSTYHAVLESDLIKGIHHSESISASNSQKRWKSIRSISIPNKVKHFMLRVLKNFLPTMVNLQQMNVPVDLIARCVDMNQRISHTFFRCQVAIQVWALSYLTSKIEPLSQENPTEWIWNVMTQMDKTDSELLTALC